MNAEARLLQRIVSELRDIDEAYWTHRLHILVEEAAALLPCAECNGNGWIAVRRVLTGTGPAQVFEEDCPSCARVAA